MNLTDLAVFFPQILIKFIALSFLVLHLLFSIIVVRQTQVMTRVVHANISPIIIILSLIHLLSSILVFTWVILFL
ncbi:hypothetical protein HYW55_05760 [Candidatus Gottesmanbacteria bacterium]|nr:hypothetical protein [Candidatus Gottesmanbacteria bacterium]